MEYAKYLLDECVENILNGSDRYTEIDFTINCLEIVADRDFTQKEWDAAFKAINNYVNIKIKGDR